MSQGFASGDLDADAWAVRYFVNDRKMEILCSQSFAKNFGLYNERPGNLVFVVNNKDVVAPVKSQVGHIWSDLPGKLFHWHVYCVVPITHLKTISKSVLTTYPRSNFFAADSCCKRNVLKPACTRSPYHREGTQQSGAVPGMDRKRQNHGQQNTEHENRAQVYLA